MNKSLTFKIVEENLMKSLDRYGELIPQTDELIIALEELKTKLAQFNDLIEEYLK